MTRALVIGRRRPGRPIREAVDRTSRQLRDAGWAVDAVLVRRKRRLEREAREAVREGVDVVVAVGGDGTVSRVLQALAGTQVALGIIPMGTGNLLASNLGIPRGMDAAAVLAGGERRRIDLGRVKVGSRRQDFAIACGVGFDADVMQAADRAAKQRLGRLAYVAGAIRRRSRVRDVPHEIVLDGQTRSMDAAQVIVANFGNLGGGLQPRLPVRPDDGLLDVIVIRAGGLLGGLLAGIEALRQEEPGATPEGRVFRARARKIRIRPTPRRRIEIDGSTAGRTPIRVSVRPATLTVIVPAAEPPPT